MTPKQLLEVAWKLIEDPKNRCTGVFARDADGKSVDANECFAVSFCSIGALEAADVRFCGDPCFVSKERWDAKKYLIQAAKDIFDCSDVVEINDSDVLNNPPKLYARAIEIASEHENNKL